jgi:hypothetical protein
VAVKLVRGIAMRTWRGVKMDHWEELARAKRGVWLAEEGGVEEEKRKVRYLPALRAHQGGWYIQLERGE